MLKWPFPPTLGIDLQQPKIGYFFLLQVVSNGTIQHQFHFSKYQKIKQALISNQISIWWFNQLSSDMSLTITALLRDSTPYTEEANIKRNKFIHTKHVLLEAISNAAQPQSKSAFLKYAAPNHGHGDWRHAALGALTKYHDQEASWNNKTSFGLNIFYLSQDMIKDWADRMANDFCSQSRVRLLASLSSL